jgi:hypothetical protein
MTVKQNHKYVAPDGHSFFPYLNEWSKSPSKSNLLGLIEVACNLFSIEPPLFSKPPPSLSAGMMMMMDDDADDADDNNNDDGTDSVFISLLHADNTSKLLLYISDFYE